MFGSSTLPELGSTCRFTDEAIAAFCPTTYSGRVVGKDLIALLGCFENDDEIAYRVKDSGEVCGFITDGNGLKNGIQVFCSAED